MYSNDYQTNAPAAFYGQTVAPQYEKNVSDAVSGPSLGIAHQQLDEAISRAAKSAALLRDTSDRILGGIPEKAGNSTVEANVMGTLPGLMQKLSWLHSALRDIEAQSARLSAL